MKVQSLDRAFNIIELLSNEQNGMTITDISKELDLHKSTVHRLLNSLKQKGYIQKKNDSTMYKIGFGFIDLCSNYLNNLELKTEAEPFLRKLSVFINQTVFLAIMQDQMTVYIDKVEKFHSLRRYSIIGQRVPLYCTALGKALLTGISDDEIKKIYENKTFISKTPNTIMNVNKLIEEISISRVKGWTFDNEEYELGVCCLSSPIYDYRNQVIAAVSASWYTNSADKMDINKNSEYVMSTALEISRSMGYRKKAIN